MKLACLSDTCAEPTRSPRSPSCVDQRSGTHLAGHGVDEHRPGVLAARLVGATPAHDLADHGLGLGHAIAVARAADARRSPARRRRVRCPGTAARGRSRPDVRSAGMRPSEVDDRDLDQRCRDVRAVAAGVHPDRTADRSGNTDRPFEAGEARGRRTGGRAPATATADRRAPTARSTSMSNVSVNAVADTTIPSKPASATSMFDPRPSSSTRSPDASIGVADTIEVGRACRPGRTPPPRPRLGRSSAGRSARRARRAAPSASSAASIGHPDRRACSASARDVGHRAPRSEAWRCRRIPSRCTRRRLAPRRPRTRTRSSRRGSHTTRCSGWASATAFTISLPVTPGIGMVPDA